jgi:hypothetical protein
MLLLRFNITACKLVSSLYGIAHSVYSTNTEILLTPRQRDAENGEFSDYVVTIQI